MLSRIRLLFLSLFVLALAAAACSKSPSQGDPPSPGKSGARPIIVFMTDFGTANDAVANCKAVILSIAPDARIMDITHRVTPYSIEEGARFLEGVSPLSRGIVRRIAFQATRDLFYGVRRHAMSNVHDARVRRDAEHNRLADGHGVVGCAEVG